MLPRPLMLLPLLAALACTPSSGSGDSQPPQADEAPAKALETQEGADESAEAPPKAAAQAPAKPADGLNRGDPAVDFTGRAVYGGSGDVRLFDFVGEAPATPKDGAMVAFGASWCGYCKASLETLKELQAENKGLQIVYVGIDDDDAGWQREIALFQEKELNFPLVRVADPEAVREAYFGDKRNIPRFYLVDHSGVVRVKDQGFTKKKMGQLLPRHVQYLLKLADRDRAASSGASSG